MALRDVTNVVDVNEGSLEELFKREWQKVLDNIADPATDPKAKRKISLEIEISPSPDRGMAKVVTKATTKLAPIKADEGAVFLELTNKGVIAQSREPEVQPDLPENTIDFRATKES